MVRIVKPSGSTRRKELFGTNCNRETTAPRPKKATPPYSKNPFREPGLRIIQQPMATNPMDMRRTKLHFRLLGRKTSTVSCAFTTEVREEALLPPSDDGY